jgi:hypothetical protein
MHVMPLVPAAFAVVRTYLFEQAASLRDDNFGPLYLFGRSENKVKIAQFLHQFCVSVHSPPIDKSVVNKSL